MTKRINRRHFIGSSALAASASMFAPAIIEALGKWPITAMANPAVQQPISSYDGKVRELLSRMTLEEKIGQMTQVEQDALKDINDIEKYSLGSLLSGGDSDPKAGNSLEAWTDMYDGYQARALKTRLAIPILYGADAVHGHNNVLGAVIFPHNVGLGCTGNARLVESAARVTSEEVRATGINWTFAPCVTHYVGDGGTIFGTASFLNPDKKRLLDQGDTQLSEAQLREIHLQGYISTVKAGVGSIMPSYNSWNGLKVSGIKRLLTDVLKQELGFEGFLISDYAAVDQITKDYKSAIEQSINAGMDMVMVPRKYEEFFNLLRELVREGKVPMSRIDDAVTRILRVKLAMGLMDKSRSPLADRRLHKTFGSAEHRQVARECVRQSLVLLKNEKKTLPLSKKLAHIHVAGKNADDIGNQCGGWTIKWQGQSGDVTT